MKNKNILRSFKYAFAGILSSIKTERNIKVHYILMLIVVLFGFLLKIDKYEWIICIILFSLVIGAEMFNTAIETLVDLVTTDINQKAKLIKDISAGAVLVFSFSSLIIGVIIFLPKLINLFDF